MAEVVVVSANSSIIFESMILINLERASRPDAIPPGPYRSQSMAIIPEKSHTHSELKSNGTTNHLPSCSGRKPSSDQQRKSTSRSSAGRARSTRPFRDSLRSAVPDTSLITMAKRPDRGGTGNYFPNYCSLRNDCF